MSKLNYCANIWKFVTMIVLIMIIREQNLHQEEIDSLDFVVDESSDDNCLMANVVVYSKLDNNNTPHRVKYTETVTELDGHPGIIVLAMIHNAAVK